MDEYIYVGDRGGATGTTDLTGDGWGSARYAFNTTFEREGYVITHKRDDVWNHRVIGSGAAHDDAKFSERREDDWGDDSLPWASMAAYYENRPGGWWDPTSYNYREGVRYYGTTPRVDHWAGDNFARHEYLNDKGLSHDGCPYEYHN